MHKLCFYVPVEHLDEVKNALFKKGAGKIGQYDCCCWQVLGEGQFRPLKGANPFIGIENKIHKVAEYKVEMVIEDDLIACVIKELIQTHPYEEPAYDVYKLVSFDYLQ